MTLTREEHMFIWMLMINLAVAVLYLVCGMFIAVPIRKKENEDEEYLYDGRKTYIVRFVIMLLCPVVAPLFFFMTHLLYMTEYSRKLTALEITAFPEFPYFSSPPLFRGAYIFYIFSYYSQLI